MKPLHQNLPIDIRIPAETGWFERVVPLLVKKRKAIFLTLLALLLVVEVIEHFLILRYNASIHLYFDAIFYAILIPAGAWVVLMLLEKTEKDRIRVQKFNDIRMQFSQELGSAPNWDSLVTCIVKFPCKLVANVMCTLFVMNPVTMRMEPEATCAYNGEVELHPVINLNPDSLPLGSLPQLLAQGGSSFDYRLYDAGAGQKQPDDNLPETDPKLPPHRYDLLITRSDQQIAVLKLEFKEGYVLNAEMLSLLKTAIPVMALALEGAILQKVAADQAAASDAERQHIAQNLHDSLAQNIGYLRLKLDQLTGENAIREIGVVLQELEGMRTTADEAYQQVRSTLNELNPIQPTDLTTMVLKQALAISKRSGFNLRTNQMGSPFALPAEVRQQILYIAREALHNIEKHARANRVIIQYLWLEHELIMKINDDGVGFDPRSVPVEGHYGLWIMQNRAIEIGGTLKINRLDEPCGTEVTLWVPRPKYSPVQKHDVYAVK